MRIAIIENTAITHHGQVGVALHEAGARVDLFKPFTGQPLPSDATAFDALVVFGGEQSALDDHSHPYLPALAQLMRRFTESEKAVLGICLGSQLLARAYGAQNLLGAAPEFGWCALRLTPDGQRDPVFAALPATFRSFQWHSDSFTLPEGAVHLAQSDVAAAQAFRIGRATYGTQFHFEANRAVVADWTREFPDLTEAMHPGWHGAHPLHALADGHAADAVGLTLARAFVAQI